MKTWNRFATAGCTIWLRDCNRRETNGSMSWRMTMAGKTSSGHLRRAIPFRKSRALEIKRQQKDGVIYILGRCEGREDKDRAIRQTQEAKLAIGAWLDITRFGWRIPAQAAIGVWYNPRQCVRHR